MWHPLPHTATSDVDPAAGGDVHGSQANIIYVNCVCCLPQCVGPSMLPTFNARGDLLLQEWLSVYTERIKAGECVTVCWKISLHMPATAKTVARRRLLGQ